MAGSVSDCHAVTISGGRYAVGGRSSDEPVANPPPTSVPFDELDRSCATNDTLTVNLCGMIAMTMLDRRNNSIELFRATRWLEHACLDSTYPDQTARGNLCSALAGALCSTGDVRNPDRSDTFFQTACRLGVRNDCGRYCLRGRDSVSAAAPPEVVQAPTPVVPSAPSLPNAGSPPTGANPVTPPSPASPPAATATGGASDIAAFLRRWYSAAYESTRLPSLDGYYTTAPFFRQGGRTGRTTSANDIFQRLSDLRTQGARFSIHWDSPNTRVVEEDEASTSNDGRLYCYERVPDGDGPVHRLDADAEATIPPGQNLSMRGCTALHGRYIVRVRVTGDGPRVCYETWSTDALCASCPHLQECAGRP